MNSEYIFKKIKKTLKIPYNKDFYKKWIAEQKGYAVHVLRSWNIKEDLNNLFVKLNLTEKEKCKFI